MARHFPHSAIKAEPHITSELHVWKKYYSTLSTMMTKSGLGWDDGRCMVTVEDDNAWDEYVKMDPSTMGMRYKSWPFFTAWREIFGKVRANGDCGTDAFKDANDIREEELTNKEDCYTGSTSRKRKVRESSDDIPRLVEMVSTFCESADTRMGTLTRVLENEFGDPDHRAVILHHVRELETFDENEHLIVANRLVKDPKELALWLGLSKESRVKWIRLMLAGRM
ncbi:UNVERIFIED_CONTAM: hypothetical protein Slati_2366100 [Sesamum latifolium]|uniref:Myb/SANT-like domain-containing protein n=1 Tax=Sesamum latifolium TaxID=2727402 RepID=A0AAW2WC19_9LAMI